MYENITTNIKKRNNNTLFICLGIALLLLIIALSLNIAKHYKKPLTNTATTKKTINTKNTTNLTTPNSNKLISAQIKINGKDITIYLPKNTPLNFNPDAKMTIITNNNTKLDFFPLAQPYPQVKEQPSSTVTQNTTPTATKPNTKKTITRRVIKRIIITPIINKSYSKSSSYSSSNSNGITISTSTFSTQNASAYASASAR